MGMLFHVPLLNLPQPFCPGDPQNRTRQTAVRELQAGIGRRTGDHRSLLQKSSRHLDHLSNLLLQAHGTEQFFQFLFCHVITTSFTPFFRAISFNSSISSSDGSGVSEKFSRTPYLRNLISL